MTGPNILIVEDDPEISAPLTTFLASKGYTARVAGRVDTAEQVLRECTIDLVLLDVMLPGESGLDFCRRLHAQRGPRIIMLTALSESMDKIVGLELGADDYVTKPFELHELLARIRAVLRRPPALSEVLQRPPLIQALTFSGFTFLPYRRLLRSPEGLRVPLTGAETDLLFVFCQHPRQVLSREELIGLTRGEGFPIAARSIDLLVSRLRRKLAGNGPLHEIIHTVRTDGYAFQAEVVVD